jgi:hypothetical protein
VPSTTGTPTVATPAPAPQQAAPSPRTTPHAQSGGS